MEIWRRPRASGHFPERTVHMRYYLSPDPSDPAVHKILPPAEYGDFGYLLSISKFTPHQAARLLEGYYGCVILDSGAFDSISHTAQRMEQWKVFFQQLEFVRAMPWVKEFVFVTYDYPILPNTLEHEAWYRLRVSVHNTRALVKLVKEHLGKHTEIKIMATLHCNQYKPVEMITWEINQLNRICEIDFYGIGGLVPLSSRKNGKELVIERVELVKKLTRKPLHLLGVGRLDVLKHYQYDEQMISADSSTFFRAAGKALRIYQNGKSRSIFSRVTGSRLVTKMECGCPACQVNDRAVLAFAQPTEVDPARVNSGYRAVHNIWDALTYLHDLPGKAALGAEIQKKLQCTEEILGRFFMWLYSLINEYGSLSLDTQDEGFEYVWGEAFSQAEVALAGLCENTESADNFRGYFQDAQQDLRTENDFLELLEGATEHIQENLKEHYRGILRRILRPAVEPVPRWIPLKEKLTLQQQCV